MNKKKPAKMTDETPDTRISSPQLHEFQVVTLANAITTRLLWKGAAKIQGFSKACRENPDIAPHGTTYDIHTAQFFSEFLEISPSMITDLQDGVIEVVGDFLNDRAVRSIGARDRLELSRLLKDYFNEYSNNEYGTVFMTREINPIVEQEFSRITNPQRGRGPE